VTGTNASEAILLDSSGWLEYITADVNAVRFANYIEGSVPLIVPTIVLHEVHKKLLIANGKTGAERFVSHALRQIVVPLDEDLALSASHISVELRLDLADAIIYATGQAWKAPIVTSDEHFRGLPGVILI
jgi:toxin FitB